MAASLEQKRILNKRSRERSPDSHRNSRLKYRFGITLDDYHVLLERQAGVCAICKKINQWNDHRTGKPKNLCIDHDHDTGKVRGLLCDLCNTAIGKLNDPELLEQAAYYLRNA